MRTGDMRVANAARRLLETPTTHERARCDCARCGADLTTTDGEVVEVRSDEESEHPDDWFCGDCYVTLLVEGRLTPIRVWKSDARRAVTVTGEGHNR